jgi:GNAT superfamily N-acetyltransferase
MGTDIRVGTRADVRGLLRMHAECSPAALEQRYLSPMPVLAARLAANLLCPPGGFSLVAEREHGIVGVTTVAPDDDDAAGAAEVGQLVSDAHQRQGIGTALLVAAAREAYRRGFTALRLAVSPGNRAVLPMVNAAGLRARISTSAGLTRVEIPLVRASRASAVHSA